MKVHIHLGVHYTDQDRLRQALAVCDPTLTAEGIRIGPPALWLPALRNALSGRGRNRLGNDWVESVLSTRNLRRLILIDEDLLGQPLHLLRDGAFYQGAGALTRQLEQAFVGHQLSLSLTLLSPEAFVRALCERYDPDGERDFATTIDPTSLEWTPTIRAMRDAAPDVPILVSRYEDQPLVWSSLLRGIADLSASTPLEADLFLAESLLPPEGLARMQSYLSSHQPKTEAQYQQVFRSFLRLYDVHGVAEGASGRLRARATARETGQAVYEADLKALARIPGVEFLRT